MPWPSTPSGRLDRYRLVTGRVWLLLIPFVMSLFALGLDRARGPSWLGDDYDPAYLYLLNGLNILELELPGHTDNPGTPVQLLAAGVIGLAHGLTGRGGTVRSGLGAGPGAQADLGPSPTSATGGFST
jgi:hypothetical protein